jgi:hypothetical protein
MNVLELITFNVKVLAVVFVSMWIRGTLPRVRIDQMLQILGRYDKRLARLHEGLAAARMNAFGSIDGGFSTAAYPARS